MLKFYSTRKQAQMKADLHNKVCSPSIQQHHQRHFLKLSKTARFAYRDVLIAEIIWTKNCLVSFAPLFPPLNRPKGGRKDESPEFLPFPKTHFNVTRLHELKRCIFMSQAYLQHYANNAGFKKLLRLAITITIVHIGNQGIVVE